MKKSILILVLTFSIPVFAASIQSLSKNDITQAVSEKTITTIPVVTLHGNLVIHNPASIFFAKNGELSGHFASKPDNDPQSDVGSWKIQSNGQLCVRWKIWTEDKPTCVYGYKLANAIVFINADKKFETMVPLNNIENGNQVH